MVEAGDIAQGPTIGISPGPSLRPTLAGIEPSAKLCGRTHFDNMAASRSTASSEVR